jgi:Uncharacterized conserved protein
MERTDVRRAWIRKNALIFLYLLSIVSANVVTAALTPLSFGPLVVPAGTLIVGLIFVLRDFVQQAIGRGRTYAVIAVAMVVSAVSSYLLGDTLWIVGASALTFALSESTDTEIFSRLRLPMSTRILYSGLIGGVLDSVIFVLVGLSPLGAGILPWEAVGMAIAGQIVFKSLMQLLAAAAVRPFQSRFDARSS